MSLDATEDTNEVALDEHLHRLRLQGRFEHARTLIEQAAQKLPAFAVQARALLRAHDERWWAMAQGRRCRLRRRGVQDLGFIRTLWQDDEFVQRFNPGAAPLPRDDAALEAVLAGEFAALAVHSRTLHWTIETLAGAPFGVLSLADVSPQHRRAEMLIGVSQVPYAGAATEAGLLAIDYCFDVLKLNKIVAMVVACNARALESFLHIGFEREGLLRQQIIDRRDGRNLDLVQLALFAQDKSAAQAQQRVRRRLLGSTGKARFLRDTIGITSRVN